MKLLAFDTTSHACSVALLDTEKAAGSQILSKSQIQPMQQGQLILPMIQSLLQTASINLNELDAIAYGQGPGSYTGARIASSVAQAVGLVARKPLIPISSLAVIAQNAYQTHGWKSVLVAVDARAGEIYWGVYEINAMGIAELAGHEMVSSVDKVTLPENKKIWFGAGDAWSVYGEILSRSFPDQLGKIDASQLPAAESMLTLAEHQYGLKNWIQAAQAIPAYLR